MQLSIHPPEVKKANVKFRLQHVRLNNGGYDRTGCYWGIGSRLYYAESEDEYPRYYRPDETISFHFRAYDRNHAKEIIKREFPNARFFN